jgi:hypothetical protein
MNVSRIPVSSIFMLAVLCGCAPRTEISTVRITDPDGGISIDVPVQRNGTFSHETKRDNVVCVTSGKISDDGGDVYSVELRYDRRIYSSPGKFTSEELKTTFKAQSDAEVPVGRNPSKPQSELSVADNALTNVTFRLLKGE